MSTGGASDGSREASGEKRRKGLFTRDFVFLFVVNLVVVSVYFLLMTTMAHYAITEFLVDNSVGGLAASIFLVGGVLGRIITGRYGTYWGLGRLSVISVAVSFASCVLYLFNFWGIGFLIAVRLIHGLAFGVANTVVPALAVDMVPRDRLGEGTGYFMLSNSLGVGIGPLISLVTVAGMDYTVLFFICTVLTALALGAAIAVRDADRAASGVGADAGVNADAVSSGRAGVDLEEYAGAATSRHSRGTRAPKPGRLTLSSIIDTSTVKLSVFMFLVALSYSSINSFVNNYAIELGMGVYEPFIFLVYSVTLIISRPLTGILMDRRGENAVLYPSIAAMAVGLVILACATTPAMLLSCGIFMALGFGTCMSTGQAAVTKLTKRNTALAMSTFFLLCDGGCGVGPFFLGMVASAVGYRAMYLLCAGIALLGVAYYHFAHGRSARCSRRAQELPYEVVTIVPASKDDKDE